MLHMFHCEYGYVVGWLVRIGVLSCLGKIHVCVGECIHAKPSVGDSADVKW